MFFRNRQQPIYCTADCRGVAVLFPYSEAVFVLPGCDYTLLHYRFHYMGTEQIIMPENYIAMFNAPQVDEAQQITAKAEPDIQAAIKCLQKKQEFPVPRNNLYDRLMSGPVNPIFYKMIVKADDFKASEACTGCGLCVIKCPMNNIQLREKKPVWGKNCTHCLSAWEYQSEGGKTGLGEELYPLYGLYLLLSDGSH